MPTIFPPVQSAKLVNPDGTGTSQLLLFLNQFLIRGGGITGGTYTKLTVESGDLIWDLDAAPVAFVTLANGVNALSVLNLVAGAPPYRITLIQPASGAAGTLTYPANFFFPGGVAPTLSTGNNAVDQLWFTSDGTNVYLNVENLNFAT